MSSCVFNKFKIISQNLVNFRPNHNLLKTNKMSLNLMSFQINQKLTSKNQLTINKNHQEQKNKILKKLKTN